MENSAQTRLHCLLRKLLLVQGLFLAVVKRERSCRIDLALSAEHLFGRCTAMIDLWGAHEFRGVRTKLVTDMICQSAYAGLMRPASSSGD